VVSVYVLSVAGSMLYVLT